MQGYVGGPFDVGQSSIWINFSSSPSSYHYHAAESITLPDEKEIGSPICGQHYLELMILCTISIICMMDVCAAQAL